MTFRAQARLQDAVITKETTDALYRWSARVDGELYVGEAKSVGEAKATIAGMYSDRILWQC